MPLFIYHLAVRVPTAPVRPPVRPSPRPPARPRRPVRPATPRRPAGRDDPYPAGDPVDDPPQPAEEFGTEDELAQLDEWRFLKGEHQPREGVDRTDARLLKPGSRTRREPALTFIDDKVLTLGDAAYFAGAWFRGRARGAARMKMTRPMYASLQSFLARQVMRQNTRRQTFTQSNRVGRSKRPRRRGWT